MSHSNPIGNGAARAACNVEMQEFCEYLMSGLLPYKPTCIDKEYSNSEKSVRWHGITRCHPDLSSQYFRWYKKQTDGKYMKCVPGDIRITPTSVMLWYLGDGSLVEAGKIALHCEFPRMDSNHHVWKFW